MLASVLFVTRLARGDARDITYLLRGGDLSGHCNECLKTVAGKQQLDAMQTQRKKNARGLRGKRKVGNERRKTGLSSLAGVNLLARRAKSRHT